MMAVIGNDGGGKEKVRSSDGRSFQSGVARWISPKYRTLVAPVSVTQNNEIFAHALSGITKEVNLLGYYYHFYTGKRAKLQDSLAKYRTPGRPGPNSVPKTWFYFTRSGDAINIAASKLRVKKLRKMLWTVKMAPIFVKFILKTNFMEINVINDVDLSLFSPDCLLKGLTKMALDCYLCKTRIIRCLFRE